MTGHYLRLFFAYVKKHSRQFIIGFGAGFVIIVLLVFIIPKIPKPIPVETVGLSGNYTVANLPLEIQNKVSFGLTQVSENYWATDSGKVWFFKIKPDIFWQDGKKLTSNDINYQLADVKISPIDELTVRFDLVSPFSPLPSITSQPLFKPGLVGLGDYKIKSFKNAGRFLKSLTISNGKKDLLYKFYPTEQILKTAFKLGEVEIIKSSDLQSLSNYKFERDLNYSRQVVAFFNTRISPTDDKAFRQGLLYSLSEINGNGTPSAGPIAPNSWGYNSQLKKYHFNLELAKKLVAKEIASGAAKIKISSVLSLRKDGEELKKFWENIGLQVDLETADYAPDNYHVFLTTVEIPQDPDQYLLWHSTSPQNLSGYKSPKSDKLLEEGRQAMDEKTRKQIYTDWQKAITEDAPAAFLYFPYVYTVSRN